MVEEGAAWSFTDADRFQFVDASISPTAIGHEIGIIHVLFDFFQAGQDLNETGVMVQERRGGHTARIVAELLEFCVGFGRADMGTVIQPG